MDRAFQPLDGIRVLLLCQYVPGPYLGQLLRQLGAEVTKIEPPGGDPLVASQPATHRSLNRGFEIEELDLKAEPQCARAKQLALECDIVVESLRPGKLTRYGLDASTLMAERGDLIYCSLSGFGQQGPKSDKVGHDPTYLAWCGVLALPTDASGELSRPSVPLADGGVAVFALGTILAAIIDRMKTGIGRHIDISFAEASMQFAGLRAGWLVDGLSASQYDFPHFVPSSDFYETADGRFVAISLHEDHFWKNFVDRLGADCQDLRDERFVTLDGRRENAAELVVLLEALFADHNSSYWQRFSDDSELPLELVQSIEAALDSEQSRLRHASEREGISQFLTYPALIDGVRPGLERMGERATKEGS